MGHSRIERARRSRLRHIVALNRVHGNVFVMVDISRGVSDGVGSLRRLGHVHRYSGGCDFLVMRDVFRKNEV